MINTDLRSTHQHRDDFIRLDTGVWTDVNDGATGTAAILTTAGSAGGVLSQATAGAINDYHVMFGPKVLECLLDRPFKASIRFKLTEAAANSAHFVFGVVDVSTNGFMTDTTGLPPASYHGACIFKPAGAAVFQCESANGTAKTTNAAMGGFVSGAWTELTILFDPGDGTTGRFQFRLNGQPTDALFVSIKDQPIALSGMTPMGVLFGVKASTAAAETGLIDFTEWEINR